MRTLGRRGKVTDFALLSKVRTRRQITPPPPLRAVPLPLSGKVFALPLYLPCQGEVPQLCISSGSQIRDLGRHLSAHTGAEG